MSEDVTLIKTTLTGARIEWLTSHNGLLQARKSGGSADLLLQAEIMLRAGRLTFPYVYRSSNDFYVMERLIQQPAPLTFDGTIFRLLAVRRMLPGIWRFSPLDWLREDQGGWVAETRHWCAVNAPRLLERFEYLYGTHPYYCGECLVHGDPTLANVMLSDALELRLIDPAPPRRAVPQLPEVDLGKLMQSLAGWEAALSADWPEPEPDALDDAISDLTQDDLTNGLGDRLRDRALWWGAFHCTRVMVRYPERGDLASWGLAAGRMLLGKMS